MAAGMRVMSTSMIQAPSHNNGDSPDQDQKMELTPWDLQKLTYVVIHRGLLFQKPSPDARDSIIQHLKRSLSSTLSFFPPLTGRLVMVDHQNDTFSSFVVCNNVGALFVRATADNTSVADVIGPNHYVPDIVNSFFPLYGVKNYQGTSEPLLAVQVTELVDGLFIGFAINHAVADEKTLWHFVNSWAEISRSSDNTTPLSRPPILERYFLDGIEPPIHFPFTAEKQSHPDPVNNLVPQPPLARIFHFEKEMIARLKSKANQEMSTDKISSFQALLSHLWRALIRNQNLDPESMTCCMVAIEVRSRMGPALGENYFGNASVAGVVAMKAGELLDGGVGKGALEINKVICLHTEDRIRGQYESWVKNPKLINLPSEVSTSVLVVSSFPRFNFFGNDFGWGKPVAVRGGPAAAYKKSASVNAFAGAEEGSVDIEICLPRQILEAMGNDPQFMLIDDAITS